MNKLKVLYQKEFNQLLFSFTGFFSLFSFPLFVSIWMIFVFHIFYSTEADLTAFFGLFTILNIIFIPILSLKLWSDENRHQTNELILTLPYSELHIILARYLVILSLLFISYISTMVFPLTLNPLGNFDSGRTLSNYIGLFLSASSSTAVCMFISSIVSGKIISWLLSTTSLIILSGSAISGGFFSLFTYSSHMESFSRGILNIGDIIYFLIITIFSLYFSKRIILLRRWS